MCEKLTLTRYLQGRGEVKALTHIEAQAFGVPYPLQPGWPARHGAMEITEAMVEDLKARILTAKESTANKARRGLEAIGDAVPAKCRTPAQPAAPLTVAPQAVLRQAQPIGPNLFPGFVRRQARRYQSRRPAPWAP